MAISVVKPGLMTTIQDSGRKGWQRFGVPVSGPMDDVTFRIANMLVGNNMSEPAMEMHFHGPELEANHNMLVSLCGPQMHAFIDEQPMPMWRPLFVKAGSRIRLGSFIEGRCAYLAAAGSFLVPAVLGSAASNPNGSLSGLAGRALRQGDRIQVGLLSPKWEGRMRNWQDHGSYRSPIWAVGWPWRRHTTAKPFKRIVRAVPGREWSSFSREIRELLVRDGLEYTVLADSNRMGFRLSGAAITLKSQHSMLSEAVTIGAMQVPPDGQPIVLMADRQSTGGYPRLLQVAAVDLPVLAQARPGERVRFRQIELEEAIQRIIRREQALRLLQSCIQLYLC